MVENIDKYPWSSHQGYVSHSKKWHWLNRDFVLFSSLLAPDIKKIKDVVCRHYMVNESVLGKSKHGVSNEPRNVAIYLARQLRTDALETIAKEFGLNRFSSTTSAIERVKDRSLKTGNSEKR